LDRVLEYPKILARIPRQEGLEFVDLISRRAITAEDPPGPPPVTSPDPGDDYLVTLASSERCVLITGDGHLLGLADQIPVYTPAGFLKLLAASPS
jgi:predicted nucleic acid-binding protein